MADLGSYGSKLIDDEGGMGAGEGENPSAQQQSSGTSGVVSGGPQGSGVSTAGVGAGGTGGWTNIQSYLGANKGDNGSSNLLQNKAQGQYDNENTALQTQAGETKSKAQGEADKIKDANDNSKQWVNQSANAYSWSGNQNDAYKGNVGKLQGALNDKYQGPENFAYQKSADFQKTGSALGDNGAFNNYMNDIYKDKAGGQLSSGMGALQTQLDVNNQNLADARKSMLGKYAGFDNNINAAVSDSDKAIQAAKTNYGNNQTALRDNLQNMGTQYDSDLSKAESAAKAGYNKDYTSGSGISTYGKNIKDSWGQNHGTDNAAVLAPSVNQIVNEGLMSDNLSWSDINRLNGKDWTGGSQFSSARTITENEMNDFNNQVGKGKDSLNNFYSEQDNKYKDTGDSEKKNWNTIMDILNNSDRKQQGFQVRGA